MALIECPECGKQISDKADTCVNCGIRISQNRCTRCGKNFPPEVRFCPYDGAAVESSSNDISSVSYRNQGSDNHLNRYPKTGLSDRIFAAIIDLLIVAILYLPFYFIGKTGGSDQPSYRLLMVLFLIPFVYSIWKDGFGKGQSWGKRLIGLMVVDINSNLPCSNLRSIARSFVQILLFVPILYIVISLKSNHLILNEQQLEIWGEFTETIVAILIFGLGCVSLIIEPLMVILSKDGRRLGDYFAGTQVIRRSDFKIIVEPSKSDPITFG